MAIIITNFAGLQPRLKPRSYGAAGAQASRNLLPNAAEFRPVLGDEVIGQCPPGTKSLYRMMRDADGVVRTGETDGWIASPEDRQYVRGQVNDDATERTVVTAADGKSPPKMLTADGEERLLGVPAPLSITVSANEVTQFTREDAAVWVDEEMKPLVQAALKDCLDDGGGSRRYVGGVPVAGAYSMHGLTVYGVQPWNGLKTLPPNLYDSQMAALSIGGNFGDPYSGIPFEIAPVWGALNATLLKDKLRVIENPKDGSQLFPDDKLTQIADKVTEKFSPTQAAIKKWRDELDAAVQRGIKAIDNASHAVAESTMRPTEPERPTVQEWYWATVPPGTPGAGDDGRILTRHPAWVQYDADMRAYEAALRDWEEGKTGQTISVADAYATVQQAQRDCGRLSNAIEDYYFALKQDLDAAVSDVIGSDFVSSMDVDEDRIIESRFYLATYVSDRGEESAPCPPSDMVEIDQNDSVSVTIPAPPSGRHITHWRLYRSSTGNGSAGWMLCDEMLISTPTYEDSLKQSQLGYLCQSLTWLEPPTRVESNSPATIKPLKGEDPYMRGAVGMANGVTAAFLDNFVAFCEPYRPFAWPVQYQITTDTPIVGLGAFGQSLFVGTRAHPYIISGSHSASMSATKLDEDQACMSAKSIAQHANGVLYASPDGICHASLAGVQLVTRALFAREDWQELSPREIVGATHDGVYYFWTPGHGVFALDFETAKLGQVDLPAGALHKDYITDRLYVADAAGDIRRLFSGAPAVGVYRSGVIQTPAQAPLAWLQVDGDQVPGVPVTVRWFADGVQRHEAVVSGIDPVRLPAGRWREHEVEVESAARVTRVLLAGSAKELQRV